MKKGVPPIDFSKPIPADVIARAIVSASRAVGADPLDVGSGKLDAVAGMPAATRVIARARFYAAYALRRVFPDRNQTMIAMYVGVNRNSAGAFFSGLDQRIKNPAGLSWWRPGIVDAIVGDIGADVRLPSRKEPAPFKHGPLPSAKLEHGPPRTGLDRFKVGGKPASYDAGGDDQLQRREVERRVCKDLLAEAAANTAKLQALMPKEDD